MVSTFLAFVVKVGIVTAEVSQSEKLKEWNGIFYVLWMTERTNATNSYDNQSVCSVR